MTRLSFGADWAMEICLGDMINAAIDDSWNESLSWDRSAWLIAHHFYSGILKLCLCDSRQRYIWKHLGSWSKFSPFQKCEGTPVVLGDATTNLVLATYFLCDFEQVSYSLCPPFPQTLTEKTELLWGLSDTLFVKAHLKPYIVYCLDLIVWITCG